MYIPHTVPCDFAALRIGPLDVESSRPAFHVAAASTMAAPVTPSLNTLKLPEIEDEVSQVLGYTSPVMLPPAKQLGMQNSPWHPYNDINDTGLGSRNSSKVIPAHVAPLQRVDSAWDENLQLSPSSPIAAQPNSILLPLNKSPATDAQAAPYPDTGHTTPSPQASQDAPTGGQDPSNEMLSMLSSLRIPQRATSQDPLAPHQPRTPPTYTLPQPAGNSRASASSKLIRLRAPSAQGSTSLDAILSQTASANAHAQSYSKRQSSQDYPAGVPATHSWLKTNGVAAPSGRGPPLPAGRRTYPTAIQSLSQVLPPGRHSPTRQQPQPHHRHQQQQPLPSPHVSASTAVIDVMNNTTSTLRLPGQSSVDSTSAPTITHPHPPARLFDSAITPAAQTPRPIPTSPGRRHQQNNQGQVTDLKASFAFDVVALHARQPQSPAPPSSPIRRPYSPFILNNVSTPHRSQRSPDKWAAHVLPGSYSPVPPVTKAATVLPARRSCSSGRRYSPSLTVPRDSAAAAAGQSPPRRSGMSQARSKLLEQFCPSSPWSACHAQVREVALQTSAPAQERKLAVPALIHGTKVLSEDLTVKGKPSAPVQDLNSSLLCEVLADKDRRAVSESGGSSSSSLGMYLIKDGQLIQMPIWERPHDPTKTILHQHVVQAPWRPAPAPAYAQLTSPPRISPSGSPARALPTSLVWRQAAPPVDTPVMQIQRISGRSTLGSAQDSQHSSSSSPFRGHNEAAPQVSLAEPPASQESSSTGSEESREHADVGASALLGYLELKFTHTVKRRQLGRVLHAWRAHTTSKTTLPSSSGPTTAVAAASAALADVSQESASHTLGPPSVYNSGPSHESLPSQSKLNPHMGTQQTIEGADFDSCNNFDDDVNTKDTYAGLYARLTQASAQPPEYSLAGVEDAHTRQTDPQQAKQHTSSAIRQLTFHGSSGNSSQGSGGGQGGGPSGIQIQTTPANSAVQPDGLHGNVLQGALPQWGYSREEGCKQDSVNDGAAGVVGGSSAIFQDLHAMIFDMEALLQRSGGSLYPATNTPFSTDQQRFARPGASQDHASQQHSSQSRGDVADHQSVGDHAFSYSTSAWDTGGVVLRQPGHQRQDSNQNLSDGGRVSGSGSHSSNPSKLWLQPQRVTALQYDKSLYASAATHASSKLIAAAPTTEYIHSYSLPVERIATTQWPPRSPNYSDPGIAAEVAAPAQLQRGSGGSGRAPPTYNHAPQAATDRSWNPPAPSKPDIRRNQSQPPPRHPEAAYSTQASSGGTGGGGSGGGSQAWRSKVLYYPPQPVYSDPGSVHDNPLLERIQRITASCLPPSSQTAPPPRAQTPTAAQQLLERQRSAGSVDSFAPPGRELSLAFPTSPTSNPALSNTLAVLSQTQDGEDGTYSNTGTPQSWFNYTAVAAAAAAPAAPAVSQFSYPPPPAGAPSTSQFYPQPQMSKPTQSTPGKVAGELVDEAALLQELTELERALYSIGGGSAVNMPTMRYFT